MKNNENDTNTKYQNNTVNYHIIEKTLVYQSLC